MTEQQYNNQAVIAELRGLKELQNEKFLRLEGILSEQKEQHSEFRDQMEAMGRRVSIIELWKENSMGKIAVLFTIVGIGISVFVGWVNAHFK